MISRGGQELEVRLRDAQASSYDDQFLKTRGPFTYYAQIATVLHYLDVEENDVVLDAGCGTGIYTLRVAETAKRVFAIDFSEKSIEVLREKSKRQHLNNIESRVGDISDCSPNKEECNKVLCIEVIQHIPPERRHRALQNVYQAMAGGGRLVCAVYRYGGWIKPPKPKEEFNHSGKGLYRYAFDAEELADLFTKEGFVVEHVSGLLILPRFVRKRLPRSLAGIEVFLSMFRQSRRISDYLILVARK